ncbi:hypothetical protein PUN28_016066 [Cardiocondyla obscurior]|uniref:Uncharacterized protein n=1 Tax=Cardiocondyla obscurior TaxID=286306 RepID=A0AAW2ET87_9HYME
MLALLKCRKKFSVFKQQYNYYKNSYISIKIFIRRLGLRSNEVFGVVHACVEGLRLINLFEVASIIQEIRQRFKYKRKLERR